MKSGKNERSQEGYYCTVCTVSGISCYLINPDDPFSARTVYLTGGNGGGVKTEESCPWFNRRVLLARSYQER